MNPQRDCTPDYRRCCHVKNNGARCTMPALRDGQLCYAHYDRQERMRRKPRPPQWADHQVPLVLFDYAEDHASILSNLNAAADAFARHDIDYRQLNAINRLYDTCLRTLSQMNRIEKAITAEEMVRDVVTTGAGELQALPDAGPSAAPGPAATPVSEPAPEPGNLAEIVACADPALAAPARPTPTARSANPPVFKLLTRSKSITPLFPTHSSASSRNCFASHTYVFKKKETSQTGPR